MCRFTGKGRDAVEDQLRSDLVVYVQSYDFYIRIIKEMEFFQQEARVAFAVCLYLCYKKMILASVWKWL